MHQQDRTGQGSEDKDRLMSLDEAAQSLGVSKDALRKRIRRGKLNASKRKGDCHICRGSSLWKELGGRFLAFTPL